MFISGNTMSDAPLKIKGNVVNRHAKMTHFSGNIGIDIIAHY
jgi:hypothetical protein